MRAAFDSAAERGMPLHARHDHHGVRRMGFGIHEDFNPSSVLPSETTSARLMMGSRLTIR